MADKKKKPTEKPRVKPRNTEPSVAMTSSGLWKYWVPVLAVTFVLFTPALQNGFTNWDDILYVTSNPLLRIFNWEGIKAIFSTAVVSNYHPLTILSLALNYQAAELEPMTWHLTSMVLHAINTGLVFWFIWLLSSGNRWVAGIVALLFGIHPMHVESVAWISERKDLLYTLFYMAAMIAYVKYVRLKQTKYLVIVTILGLLSLLSKPAAIVLPLSLLAVDFYLRRPWNKTWILEKIPLFIFSGIFAYTTMAIQAKRAIASVDAHSIVDRINYAGFGFIWYLVKLVVPFPLSALHPFPKELTPVYYLATFLCVALALFLIFRVKNRNFLFGLGFYLINLLLVLQLVSIGNAVVAERYTYVPYIGIFFMLAMELYTALQGKWSKLKPVIIGVSAVWIVALAFLTWTRIPVWKNSETLWDNVLAQYPESPRAWTNRGLHFYDKKDWPKVINDLSKALEIEPNFADALEWRTRAYMETKEYEKALTDATRFYKGYPNKEASIFLMARTLEANGDAEESINIYNQLIVAFPNKPEYYNNRGVINFNRLKKYGEAKADFEEAIRLYPTNGSYYVNLARCYYMMSDLNEARKNALKGKELGAEIDAQFAQLIGFD